MSVAILNARTLRAILTRAQVLKVTVSEGSKAMEHPLETGATIVDHRIVLPIQLDLSLMMTSADYRAVYQELRDLFLKATLVTVQTRVASYVNMLIEKIPHEESGDVADGIALALTLKEARFVTPAFSAIEVAPDKPASTNTAKRGQQTPAPASSVPPERKKSVLASLTS